MIRVAIIKILQLFLRVVAAELALGRGQGALPVNSRNLWVEEEKQWEQFFLISPCHDNISLAVNN